MSELQRILGTASRLERTADPGTTRLAEELYKSIVDSDSLTIAQLLELAPLPERPNEVWQRNNLRIAPPFPQRVVDRIPNMEAFQPFLRRAVQQGHVVKAIGDGWGMSGAGESRDWLLPMSDSFDEVSPPVGRTCRMAGGARVGTLNAVLERAGLSLSNAPGYEGLTFIGAMSMGGHGSGLGLGPLAAQAVSVELLSVDAQGKPRQQKFEKQDPLFPAVVTSLGALGIVTGLTIEVEDAYFIDETRTLRRWNDVKREVPELLELQRQGALHSIEIWLNPYPVQGEVWCVLGTRAKSKGPAQGQRGWGATHGDRRGFEALSAFMRAFPQLIPRLLHGALSLTQASNVVMPSAIGLGFGTANRAPVLASECSIDVGEMIPTVESLLRGVQRRAAQSGLWVTSPIGLRFVAAGSAWMSPAHARETCTIELPLLDGTAHTRETLEWFSRIAVPHGRPHWGQWNPLSGAELRERYPRECTREFARALEALDPRGVFTNDFVRDLRSAWGAATLPRQQTVMGRPQNGECGDDSVRAYSRLFCDAEPPPRVEVPLEDILGKLKDAKETGVHFTRRGGGYAMHTQSLRPNDVDARYLGVNSPFQGRIVIDERNKRLKVKADATWHAIVHATLAKGLMPMVIVTAPNATVGGTLASNSIGQACRRFGHEADGLVDVTVALPGRDNEEPIEKTLKKPEPGDESDDAQLFRAVIRGYGHIGVITAATYQLIDVPVDVNLPPVDQCGGRSGHDVVGERCVAVTDVEPFAQDQLDQALSRLIGSRGGDDGLYRACVLFKLDDGWNARVTTTRFETGTFGPHLVTYEGDSTSRNLAELLLSTMPTAYVAGRIAAKVTENGKTGYHDPPCGFLFTMLANETFKAQLPKAVTGVVGTTIQMTFIIPESNAVEFLNRSFHILKLGDDPDDRDQLNETLRKVAQEVSLKDWIVELVRKTRELEIEYFGNTRLAGGDSDEEMLRDVFASVLVPGSLIPSLFEMVWLPADDHLLSALHGAPGFAISMAFQGPGTNPRGFLEQRYPFREVCVALYRALGELSDTAIDLGGGVHLTKNVFVGDDPKTFISRMLGDRLTAFAELRARYDEKQVLSSAFGDELLGLPSVRAQT